MSSVTELSKIFSDYDFVRLPNIIEHNRSILFDYVRLSSIINVFDYVRELKLWGWSIPSEPHVRAGGFFKTIYVYLQI